VIAFVAVTSILNVALGYVLARYLGRAAADGAIDDAAPVHGSQVSQANEAAIEAAAAAATLSEQRSEQRQATWVPAADHATEAVAAHALGSPAGTANDANVTASAMPNALSSNTSAPGERLSGAAHPEVEEELLAGIEQFRSQLAKIKGMTQDQPAEPQATPSAVAVAH
jgi:hypothetical protein